MEAARKGGVRGNDAALPRRGKGALPVCGIDAVCPCGAKALQSWRAGFWFVAGQRWMKKRFALQERSGRRARKTKHTVLRSMRPPRPRNHPAGRTAGSARTRSRDQSLENPFLGTARPQRRRRQAPARGPAAVYSLHRPNRNVSQRPSPLLVGLGRVYFEPKALAAGTAGPPARGAGVRQPRANGYWSPALPANAASAAWSCASVCASGAWKTTLASAARATSMSGVTPWPWMERPEGV